MPHKSNLCTDTHGRVGWTAACTTVGEVGCKDECSSQSQDERSANNNCAPILVTRASKQIFNFDSSEGSADDARVLRIVKDTRNAYNFHADLKEIFEKAGENNMQFHEYQFE